ncbi:hypothetical protein Sp245p_05570 [Azospirillum baldaniorum]|uniref:Uncharacterized protein n=1 Tax=Azospirillum baldaniorum TaxID=1064539 RepID=A0A9P1JSC6_9PROT|nr:hypothetical protein [Azospirillum baldaniorum]AWJ89290.1 hypothetical protein Sp245p_05570 [Azospirillum baldaniorum]TWA80880.1 hypothetical protein FBZ85_103324 [Azospirillum brasilense]CCC98865.1 protein of unknown function [Azospirillum baldaniorum]
MTKRPMPAYERALLRACRARYAFVPLTALAIPYGLSKQRISQICKGIVAGLGDDLQADKLRRAYEQDIRRTVSDAEWVAICARIDADVERFLTDAEAAGKVALASLTKEAPNAAR